MVARASNLPPLSGRQRFPAKFGAAAQSFYKLMPSLLRQVVMNPGHQLSYPISHHSWRIWVFLQIGRLRRHESPRRGQPPPGPLSPSSPSFQHPWTLGILVGSTN
jgi:hypothetical protein